MKKLLGPLAGLLPALVAGLLFCMGLGLLLGVGPFDLIATLADGSWGSLDAAATTLSKTTPLLLTGLAVSLACQVNLLNIGCEGQLALGALACAGVANGASGLPGYILAPLVLLVGALAGGLWAYPAIWLKQRHGVHEVISTLLLNYMAIYCVEILVLGPLGDGSAMGRTPELPAEAVWLPWWQIGASGVTAAPLVALILSLVFQVWLSGTVRGYEVMATGANATAAQAAGIEVERWQRRLFFLSGALAGLAGALEVVAVHHRFYRAFSPGYGFDGITVAFLVDTTPGWLGLSALLLASLRTADKSLQLGLGVSPSAILVIQAFLLMAAAGRHLFQSNWRSYRLPSLLRRAPNPAPAGNETPHPVSSPDSKDIEP